MEKNNPHAEPTTAKKLLHIRAIASFFEKNKAPIDPIKNKEIKI